MDSKQLLWLDMYSVNNTHTANNLMIGKSITHILDHHQKTFIYLEHYFIGPPVPFRNFI